MGGGGGQVRQYTYNVTLWRIRVNTVATETQRYVLFLIFLRTYFNIVNKPTHTVCSFQLILVFYSLICTEGSGYSF